MSKAVHAATGTCKFCGQQTVIHLPEGKTADDYAPDEFDKMAAEQCTCEKATRVAGTDKQKRDAVKRMREHFDTMIKKLDTDLGTVEEQEKLREQAGLLCDAIECVADDVISTAVIYTSQSEQFRICFNAKGELRIIRTYKGSEEWIF